MEEKQDIAMNQFPVVTDLSYVYGEKSNNQNKIAVEDLKQQMGVCRINIGIPAGGQIELPFSSGLIIISNASLSHEKAVATLLSDNSGIIIVSSLYVNFFSEVKDKICVMNTGNYTKYIIKNTYTADRTVVLTFIN